MQKQSNYLKNIRVELESLIENLNKKYAYASILATDCEGTIYSITDKDVSIQDSFWQERGFVVRIFHKGLYSEYSFDHLPTIKEVVKKIADVINIDEVLEKSIYVQKAIHEKCVEEKQKEDFSRMEQFIELSDQEIVDRCRKMINRSMEQNEYIISANCKVEVVHISKLFISEKKNLLQDYAWVNASYKCIVNRDECTKVNYGGSSGISVEETLRKLERKVFQINEDATALLDSYHITPGEYDCITSPEVTGLIAHEAFGHGVEMDMFVKNRAKAAEYMNQRVGSELVNMHEGALPYKDVSSYFFDDEGTLAQDTIEIKEGILIHGIADVLAANSLHILPTGNGKRESYARKAYTRMTATYFEPGKDKLSDMIKSIDYGLLIDTEMSGMEDPKNWGIQCICLIGKEIKNGKLTGKIFSPIYLTGYVPELLQSISMVSNDFELFGNGECGKGYKEWVKTSVGGPYLKARVKLG